MPQQCIRRWRKRLHTLYHSAMARRKTKQWTAHAVMERAAAGGYAIGAFNVSELLTLKAVVNAAVKLRAPVIIETSSGETNFIGDRIQTAILREYEKVAHLPILINLDHAKSAAVVRHALAAGFDMLHFDGSELSVAQNVRILKSLVPLAHASHRLVEGERDHITGSSEWHRRTKMEQEQQRGRYTDPDEAHAFVQATNIDIFASFIGNVHGVFANEESLDIPLLKKIHTAVPCWLSLHGGSGIRATDVRAAIRHGITKVNVNTELRLAYVAAVRRAVRSTHEIAPYKLFPPVITAVQKVVEQKIKLFGSTGKATRQ